MMTKNTIKDRSDTTDANSMKDSKKTRQIDRSTY